MSLKKLIKLVPPPKKPIETGSKTEWAKVEKELGTPLPSDYKEFIGKYGTGAFADIFYVFSPFASQPDHNLLDELKQQREYYTVQRQDEPEEYPYEIYPKKPGLLPWGRDGVSNGYFWLVKEKAKPDEWPVVFYEPRGKGFQEFNCTFSGYLEAILAKKIKAPMGNYPRKESFNFEPFKVQEPVSAEALISAIQRNDLTRVRELLDAGLDLNEPQIREEALQVATQQDDYAIAKYLISRGADPNGDGSLLGEAAEAGQVHIVLFLLDAGAEPNHISGITRPPLFGAANRRSVEMVRALLAKGADPNINLGITPIFKAAQYNEPAAAEVIQILAEHGADLTVKNEDGLTPLQFAKKQGGPLTVAALEEAMAKTKAGKKK